MKVYIKNCQRLLKPNQQRTASLLRKALRLLGLHKAEISILFVNDERMRILNRRYRGIDRTTDVLSFPQNEFISPNAEHLTPNAVLGDIVISLPKTKKQAEENGLTFHQELKKLLIHGLLHLIGYDHEINRYQENKMRKKAKELLDNLN
jgi:probable rRNA maturation factor